MRLNRSRSYLHILVLNEEWQEPEDGFDPDALVEPGMFSNVEGGLGLVGGGYRKDASIVLLYIVLNAAGFATGP